MMQQSSTGRFRARSVTVEWQVPELDLGTEKGAHDAQTLQEGYQAEAGSLLDSLGLADWLGLHFGLGLHPAHFLQKT